MLIENRTILISGASSGIGAAIAKAMARQGGHVLLLARKQDALEKVAAEIKADGGTASVYSVDLSDPKRVEETAMRIKQDVGTPDILINNAGAGRWLSLEKTSPTEVVEMMALPYFAAFYLTQQFLPLMRRRNSGYIVNITSVAAYFALPETTGYTVARWAMRGFTETLRTDLQGTNIRVLQFASSTVKTPYFENNQSQGRIPSSSPLIPILTPEHVAEAIAQGVKKDRLEIILPWGMEFFVAMHRFFPQAAEQLFRLGAKKL